MTKERAWLCLGPMLFCLLDGTLTLVGQSDAYWAGQFQHAEELNPLGLWPLQHHPLCFAAVVSAWALAFCSLICVLPGSLAWPLAFVVQLGHTIGAASWVLRQGTLGWLACVLLFMVSKLLLGHAWRRHPASSAAQ